MRALTRTIVAVSLLVVLTSRGDAQSLPSAAGHWEGAVQIPEMELAIEIDLKANGAVYAGTFSQPVQGVKGLPLSTVVVEGKNVRFVVRAGQAPATFQGLLSDDGTLMSGQVEQGGQSVPFKLTRNGDARIAPVPVNGPIAKELEGSWNGAIEAGGRSMRLVLKMANQTDGAIGTIMSPDGSGVEIPIAITQKGLSVTIGVPSIAASFAGTLNPEGTELAGQWTQGPVTVPLTFQRSK